MVIRKLDEKASSGKVKSALFGDSRGLIKTFAVLTAENPMTNKTDDLENRQRNNRLRKEIEKKKNTEQKASGLSKEDYFRKLHIQYIPIEGHYGGNKERSYIVLNIPYADAEYLATAFEQESFFFGTVYTDKTAEVSFYQRDSVDEPFRLIETTDRVDDATDFEEFFSKYGDIKWSFYLKIFNESYVERPIVNRKAFDESFESDKFTPYGRMLRRHRADGWNR